MRLGVVDVGTNSVRVLIADAGPEGDLTERARDLIITRLGEGVDRDRVLGEVPMRRTVDAVSEFVMRCRDAGTDAVRVIATSAVRDAANREAFLHGVRAASGSSVDVLSGEDEARLGFLGATVRIDAPSPFLVVDIGGGSTELVLGDRAVERFISMDIGSVRLTERHVHSDPPHADEIEAVRADADAHLDDGARAIGEGPIGTLVGLAGTITTVAAIALGLGGYDRDAIHHSWLTLDRIQRIRTHLAGLTSAQRRGLPAMPRGREDVIVGGVVILEQVMARFGCRSCLVSESDILDGAALDLQRVHGIGPVWPGSSGTR